VFLVYPLTYPLSSPSRPFFIGVVSGCLCSSSGFSLGGDKDAIKADREYQRGRKKELRGEELKRRGKTKRGQNKYDKGREITDKFR